MPVPAEKTDDSAIGGGKPSRRSAWGSEVISHDRFFLDRLATHILAFEGDSHVEWFEGNFAKYEEDKKRRLGEQAIVPHRIKYKKFTR